MATDNDVERVAEAIFDAMHPTSDPQVRQQYCQSSRYRKAATAALQAIRATDEGLVRQLLEAAQPFADSVVIDPEKKRGDRHWATIGKLTNLDQVVALKAAIEALSNHQENDHD